MVVLLERDTTTGLVMEEELVEDPTRILTTCMPRIILLLARLVSRPISLTRSPIKAVSFPRLLIACHAMPLPASAI